MRRFLFILSLVLAGALVALAALPWWLAPVLRWGGAKGGATFERYERLGYARFAVHGVRVAQPGVDVWVERVEAPTPILWGWRHVRGQRNQISAAAWEVEATAREAGPGVGVGEGPVTGWVPLRDRLFAVVEQLDRWLPEAEVGPGDVRAPGVTLRIGASTWRERTLTVSVLGYRRFNAGATVSWPAGVDEFAVTLESRDLEEARGEVRSRAGVLQGEFTLWGQIARGQAQFGERGWLPVEAQVSAVDWRIEGERLGLGERYSAVAGNAEASWRDARLELAVAASGEPVPEREAPPLAVELRGSGTASAFTVEALDVRIPGIRAELSAPITINPAGSVVVVPSRFTLDADLAGLPWGRWRGTVRGVADVAPADDPWPVVTARLEAQNTGHDGWEVRSATLGARLDWPRLQIEEARMETTGEGELEAAGGWDFSARELLATTVQGKLGPEAVARWLPDGVTFETVEFDGTAAGSWPEIVHEGSAQFTGLDAGPLKALAGEGSWSGRGAVIDEAEVAVRAGSSAITARGGYGSDGLRLGSAEWTGEGGEVLRLAAPTTIRWAETRAIEALRLEGPAAELAVSLQIADGGRIAVTAAGLESSWLEDWIELRGPAWRVASLRLNGEWPDGPLVFSSQAEVSLALGEERWATLDFTLEGDADGVRIVDLNAAEGDAPIIRAQGRLPVSIWPAQSPRLRIDGGKPIALTVTSEPNPEFWQQIAELTDVKLAEPLLTANLGGTWERPRGELTLSARELTVNAERWKRSLPEISALVVRVVGDGEGVDLEEFSLRVAGQEVRAQGRLPLVPGQWEEVRRDPRAFLETGADLRIEIPDAEMAALARFVPEYLAPTGRLQVDVAVRPGGELDGFLKLSGAASRPLGPLGVLQDIGADIQLKGRQINLRAVTARTGGQPVTLSGTLDLPKGGARRLALALKGENLPFVRQTGLLVRGDLDLQLATLDDGVTRITGTTRLRDSLFLSDVRALIPRGGRGAAPTRRPPYFAVEVAPLRDWQLDVEVVGDRFLRLRTAVFTGAASARFRLSGTLGDPRAIGEATVHEGRVLLPFASFRVQQGWVRITEADPYEPSIMITGSTRRFGYDVRMELSGPASSPNLTFNSSPPLESEQVLLMVMAGEAPGDEVAYTGGQRAVRLGTYLGQSLINRIGGDPGRAERFSLTTGERVSRQGRETYGFAYELGSRWSLIGEYDEFDDYNAGVKWRVFAREEDDDSRR